MELATVYQKRAQPDQQAALIQQLKAAYGRGIVPATRVDSVARVLADRSLGQTDEKTAKELLEQVAPVNPASWVSLAQLVYDFPELGDNDQLLAYIEKGRQAQQPRAELLLGRLYYEGKTLPADASKAEEHLQAAAAAGEVSAHYYLGQLYRRGYLGHVEPQKPSTTCSVPPVAGRTAPTTPWPNCSAKVMASALLRPTPGCSPNWPRPTRRRNRPSCCKSSTRN